LETERAESKQELLQRLIAEHTALKARVRELERLVSLTSDEQAEIVHLKKQKLRTKDRLYLLQRC
jgi:uncharacterized protein YdcH (DUF465 family)